MGLNLVQKKLTALERQTVIVQMATASAMAMAMDLCLLRLDGTQWAVQHPNYIHHAPTLVVITDTSTKWEDCLLHLSTLWLYLRKIQCHIVAVPNRSPLPKFKFKKPKMVCCISNFNFVAIYGSLVKRVMFIIW